MKQRQLWELSIRLSRLSVQSPASLFLVSTGWEYGRAVNKLHNLTVTHAHATVKFLIFTSDDSELQ